MLRCAVIALTFMVLAQDQGCLDQSVPSEPEQPDSGQQNDFHYPGDPTKPRVRMDTTFGTMVVQLYPEESPITVDNFLMYVNDGHYDGTLFHRVVDDGTIGVVQGGGYDSSLDRLETEDPIVNESNNGLQNLRGTIAMARTSQANSATDQFYFNTTDNPTLDFNFQTRTQGYAVFGEIVFGLDVLDVIRQQPTENRGSGFADIPVDDIFILRARELSPDE